MSTARFEAQQDFYNGHLVEKQSWHTNTLWWLLIGAKILDSNNFVITRFRALSFSLTLAACMRVCVYLFLFRSLSSNLFGMCSLCTTCLYLLFILRNTDTDTGIHSNEYIKIMGKQIGQKIKKQPHTITWTTIFEETAETTTKTDKNTPISVVCVYAHCECHKTEKRCRHIT